MKKLLVLKEIGDRKKLAEILAAAGVKVIYDSGGRVLVVDVPKNAEDKLRQLPFSAQLIEETEASRILARPDENEKIFLGAVALRKSQDFKAKLNKFKPGESPEEIELLSAPHFLDEENGDLQ